MNDGKLLKRIYSPDKQVSQLISDAVNKWEFGYCEHALTIEAEQDDRVFFEIPAQPDKESAETIIDAVLHMLCGVSLACMDFGDFDYWLSRGNRYRTLTIEGSSKELAHELWVAINESLYCHKKNGFEVTSVIITVFGDIDVISIEEFGMYSALIRSLGIECLQHSCLFYDKSLSPKLKVYQALQPLKKLAAEGTDDIPAFLKRPPQEGNL